MTLVETPYRHIILNEKQVPIIAGTTMMVEELVIEYLAYGWSPEELCDSHPYLTMGQVLSALAYYWDNKVQMDQEIQEGLEYVDHLRQEQGPTPLEERLRAQKAT
ncbi:MAG TPA: DUF433 domain-containing protein [Ardenticatenaceae bacterium]|jgi:uncharacterized protein (DUF433 family)